jgi:phosphoglycerate dehydrogenase-like enzyme
MIRILIADDLSPKTIDKLNEIPEFEISEKMDPLQANFVAEIKNADALVLGAATPLPAAALQNAVNLKIMIKTGAGPDRVEPATTSRKNIEIHTTPLPASPVGASAAENREREGADVIAILKDFFNV